VGLAGEMDVDLRIMVAVLRVVQVSDHACQDFMLQICSKNTIFLALTDVRYLVSANLTFGVDNLACV
jgi:hypothetical protein